MIRQNITLFLVLTFITGIVFPLIVTIFCELLLPYQSRGSLMEYASNRRASELVGQSFTEMQYFWGRPSVTAERPYNLMAGTSSNLSNKSMALQEAKLANRDKLTEIGYISRSSQIDTNISSEMLLASASGLDPHISIKSALEQIPRVANERSVDSEKIEKIVLSMVEYPLLGIFGESRINVFKLNLALDKKNLK